MHYVKGKDEVLACRIAATNWRNPHERAPDLQMFSSSVVQVSIHKVNNEDSLMSSQARGSTHIKVPAILQLASGSMCCTAIS